MDENSAQDQIDQDKLENIEAKTQKRIKQGRDPFTAHWHGILESLFLNIKEELIPGEIITPDSMQTHQMEHFEELQTILDMSPFTNAVFLPSGIKDVPKAPKTAQSIEPPPDDSIKILVSRVNNYNRILTAEISPSKPGIDIFEDGSLLASYNYGTSQECISDLSKIIWIHFKHQDQWTKQDYIKYTESWFYRSVTKKIKELSINVNHSYIHHPVLINLNPIQAIFKLMKATLSKLLDNIDHTIESANAANLYKADTVKITKSGLSKGQTDEKNSLYVYIDERLMGLLKLLRGYGIINFKSFSAKEQKEFKITFTKTVDQVFQEFMQKIFNIVNL